MARGRVKWFNETRGYGFIEQDMGDVVYVHFASIEMPGYKTLSPGQTVEFDLTRTPDHGLEAGHVSIVAH